MTDEPEHVAGYTRQRRRFRRGWVGLLTACLLIAAVTLTAVAYPFRYVNDWIPPTRKAKAVALVHEAHALVARSPDPVGRAQVFSGEVEYETFPGIAEVLVRAGRRAEAIQVAREALRVLRELQKEDAAAGSTLSREWYLAVVTQTFAYAGETHEAISIARTLHRDSRVVAFAAIIDAEVRAGRTAQAAALMPELVNAARGTKGNWELRYYLGQVNSTLARAGLHHELQTELKAVLPMMKEDFERDFVRQTIADSLASAGRTAEALSMARAAERPVERVVALARVSQHLAAAGRRQEALNLAGEALPAARVLPDAYSQSRALSEVAQALVDAGRPVEAARVARQARELARRSDLEANVVIVHVVPALASAGRVPEAVTALSEVRARADWEFNRLVDNLVDRLIASRRLVEALAVAERAPDAERRNRRLNKVALAFVKEGQNAAAIRVAREALELTRRLKEPQLEDVANAAVTLARARAKAEALRLVREALRALDQAGGHDGAQYDWIGLFKLAEALAIAGDRPGAMRLALRAQDQSPSNVGDAAEQEITVIVDTAEAGAIAAAVDLARTLSSPVRRAQALTAIASVVLKDEPFPLCCESLP